MQKQTSTFLVLIGLLFLAGCGGHPAPATLTITEFRTPPNSEPFGMTAGPDGNLWFLEIAANKVGRLTPAGQLTEFPLPPAQHSSMTMLNAITAGPDGNLWFTEEDASKIGRITPAGQLTEFAVPNPLWITAGPDGNLWFTEGGHIGRITPTGQITLFSEPGGPVSITAGRDGNLWFTEDEGNQIGRITPTGQLTEFPLPTHVSPWMIVAGPDGNLWFTEIDASQIGRITPNGQITEFSLPSNSNNAWGITAGPDGNLLVYPGRPDRADHACRADQPVFFADAREHCVRDYQRAQERPLVYRR